MNKEYSCIILFLIINLTQAGETLYHRGHCGDAIEIRTQNGQSLQECESYCRLDGGKTNQEFIAVSFNHNHFAKGECICYIDCKCWDYELHHETIFFSGMERPNNVCAPNYEHGHTHYIYKSCVYSEQYQDMLWTTYGCDPFNGIVMQNLYDDQFKCIDKTEPNKVVVHNTGQCFEQSPGEWVKVERCTKNGLDLEICEDLNQNPPSTTMTAEPTTSPTTTTITHFNKYAPDSSSGSNNALVYYTNPPTNTPVQGPICSLQVCGCPGSEKWNTFSYASPENCAPSGYLCQKDKINCEMNCGRAIWCPHREIDGSYKCKDCLRMFDKAEYCEEATEIGTVKHHWLSPDCKPCIWEILNHCEKLVLDIQRRQQKDEESGRWGFWHWFWILFLFMICPIMCCFICFLGRNGKEKSEQEEILLDDEPQSYDYSNVSYRVEPESKAFSTGTPMYGDIINSQDRSEFVVGEIVEARHDIYDSTEGRWKLGVIIQMEPVLKVRHLDDCGNPTTILKCTEMRKPEKTSIDKIKSNSSRHLIEGPNSICLPQSALGSPLSYSNPNDHPYNLSYEPRLSNRRVVEIKSGSEQTSRHTSPRGRPRTQNSISHRKVSIYE